LHREDGKKLYLRKKIRMLLKNKKIKTTLQKGTMTGSGAVQGTEFEIMKGI